MSPAMIAIAAALPILLSTAVHPASAAAEGGRARAEAPNDGSCPTGDGDATLDATAATARPAAPPPRRNRNVDELSPDQTARIERVDEILRTEIEGPDPIVTCDDYLEMGEGHGDFVDPVAVSESFYQEMSWAESADKPDKCLTLDETLQICDSYRPHYHEHFVHFPASFLPRMKRAVFVGGGDSMLLHEVLKHPELELVVGLELDQRVVRESLRHFFTRPHFELYPKVQWWFGDAAKSLLLLPKEWYGTFDLVMVDLSETVMSTTVSEELDILRALALLLDPEHGIFVKNEKYLEELSDIFDHVIQIYLDNTPLLCDQDWVLGSFGIDFLRPDFGRLEGVETLHYRPREGAEYHHGLIKDYDRNEIDAQSHCAEESGDGDKKNKKAEEEGKKFGVSLMINAEGASLLSNSLRERLLEALKGIGDLRIATSGTFSAEGQWTVVILLHEGYIVARAWPDLQYCSFDVTFWSRFGLLEAMREALLHAVVANESSSYRVVVGGMYGMDAWREDMGEIGPKKGSCLDRSNKAINRVEQSKRRMEEVRGLSQSQIAIQESLSLLPSASNEKLTAVVFCGVQSEGECESLVALSAKVRTVVLWTCPSEPSGESTEPDELNLDAGITLCEVRTDDVLKVITDKLGKLRLLVIDGDVPPASAIDVADALTKVPLHSEDSLVSEDALFVLPKLKHLSSYFLEICRLNLFDDLLRLAVVSLDRTADAEPDIMMGYLTIGNPMFLSQLADVTDKISQSTGVGAALIEMRSNPVRPQSPYAPREYTMFDYDEGPGMEQYAGQMPLGKQSLLQMKFDDMTMTKELLETRAQDFLKGMGVTDAKRSSHKVGDGIVTFGMFDDGHITVVWNGRQNIDLNIFTLNETVPHKSLFEEHFVIAPGSVSTSLTLWEEQPRGLGRVVNFSKDIVALPGCVDRFVLCDELEKLGECHVTTEKEWMYANCPLACGRCSRIQDP